MEGGKEERVSDFDTMWHTTESCVLTLLLTQLFQVLQDPCVGHDTLIQCTREGSFWGQRVVDGYHWSLQVTRPNTKVGLGDWEEWGKGRGQGRGTEEWNERMKTERRERERRERERRERREGRGEKGEERRETERKEGINEQSHARTPQDVLCLIPRPHQLCWSGRYL